MGTLVQSVLPFRVEDTDKLLTANTELTLFGKFVYGQERLKNLIRKMPIIMHLSQTTLSAIARATESVQLSLSEP